MGLLPPASTSLYACSHVLNQAEAGSLANALREDANDYFYSGCVSFLDALRGLNRGYFSWSTAKLYYSVFYSFRSLLAIARTALLYIGTTPHSLKAMPGETAKKRKGTTHKATLDLFVNANPGHVLLSQMIGSDDALQWLMSRREECNYMNSRFCEPVPPRHFMALERIGLRRLLATYMADESDTYTFDEDHAMIAFPVRVIRLLTERLALAGGVSMNQDEISFISHAAVDADGPIPCIRDMVLSAIAK
jgi:hypothetical protein